MTQTKHKFKIGDLVQHHDKDWYSIYGIGIIIGPKQSLWGPAYDVYWSKYGLAYDVYWSKKGLDWDLEEYLKRVFK